MALTHGWAHLLKYAIKVGFVDWNWGLYWACQGGDELLTQFMIDQGANDWNGGFSSACNGGHES